MNIIQYINQLLYGFSWLFFHVCLSGHKWLFRPQLFFFSFFLKILIEFIKVVRSLRAETKSQRGQRRRSALPDGSSSVAAVSFLCPGASHGQRPGGGGGGGEEEEEVLVVEVAGGTSHGTPRSIRAPPRGTPAPQIILSTSRE